MKHAIQLCTCCVLALFFFTACTEKSPVQTSYSIEHAGKTFVTPQTKPLPTMTMFMPIRFPAIQRPSLIRTAPPISAQRPATAGLAAGAMIMTKQNISPAAC